MALKQDERALLQLVCERGQSYVDIAELLGGTVDEVRAKARTALGELGGGDPDADVGLTDYLLGQADPIGRADAVRHLQQDPDALALAREILTRLQAIAPGGQFPRLPEPRGKRRRAAMPAPGEAATPAPTAGDAPARAPRSQHQSRMIAAIAGLGVILLFSVLAIAGVFSSDDSGASDSSPEAIAESQRTITSVKLEPQDDSAVAGQADFGLASDQLYVDLKLSGLNPQPPKDSVYVLWLMLTEDAGYPVTIVVPTKNGSVGDRYAVPTPVAVVVGSNARFVQVSASPAQDLQDRINEAVDSGAPLVPFSGNSLARGEIPLAADVSAP